VESLAAAMEDRRDPTNFRYTLCELLRERVFRLAVGWTAADDVDRLGTIRRCEP
jgi:hypothetical protein